MSPRELPARPNLEQYRKQAKDLVEAWRTSDVAVNSGTGRNRGQRRTLADAQHQIARDHGFDNWKAFTVEVARRAGVIDNEALWKKAESALVAGDEARLAQLLREHELVFRTELARSSWLGGLTPNYQGTARQIILKEHYFDDWDRFTEFMRAVHDENTGSARFERAADAIAFGDESSLARIVSRDPAIVHARSERTHRSTLLHYAGANGIESWRQRTPKNALRIAEMLLDAGAVVDAAADMYGGGSTTLGLVATSIHPKVAGLQEPLMALLIARGASVGMPGSGHGMGIINGCLANGRPEAAAYLAEHGAPIDLEAAAGIGRLDLVKSFFTADGTLKATATAAQLKDGFTWACEYGHTAVVEYLLGHGVNAGDVLPRPHGQTGLHWAAIGGHVDTVNALLAHHPPVDVRDASFNATPLGWAIHGWWERRDRDESERDRFYAIVTLLVDAGAPVEPRWLTAEHIAAHPRMADALRGIK